MTALRGVVEGPVAHHEPAPHHPEIRPLAEQLDEVVERTL
jgi:hypothetical protein